MPTVAIVADHGPIGRAIVAAMQLSSYFDIKDGAPTEAEARAMLARGDVAFIVTIPNGFERDLVRGERPQILIEADATDPAAAAGGLGALPMIVQQRASSGDRRAALPGHAGRPAGRSRRPPPLQSGRHHRLQHRAGAARRDPDHDDDPDDGAGASRARSERGTMENLMAMPARPIEIMIGKIVPYIGFGFVQIAVILIAAKLLFQVPMEGPLTVLLSVTLIFIAANVTLGYTSRRSRGTRCRRCR